ncbi:MULTISPECIES: YicC/YloC family endoribonuclease [unclassified Roseovarius]|uniref:YicC/YloC family endoribonuclease n=1 Tax=unclassified Roseovarius TaxID=2614913 RepID=UPI00273E3C1B|nr:YicC/YloC family endoribonuclease [Roseovarius sp. MMSF_3350]
MTGFAAGQGAQGRFGWTWDLRAVNGRGLDLRLRVPDWIEGLEAGLRARLTATLGRGNVTLSLKLQAQDGGSSARLDEAQLGVVLTAMTRIEARAMEMGLSLAPANAADVLALRGVFEPGTQDEDTAALGKALLADFETVLSSFLTMRRREGAALAEVLTGQLTRIAELTDAAAAAAEARRPETEANFRAALQRVMDNADGVDEARIAQELAVLAVKTDVTEEIDRLRSHVAAARDLIAGGSPAGRKLDFLAQEFNREANTLCSKAQNSELTSVGLELKSVIEQMREQVQNVE